MLTELVNTGKLYGYKLTDGGMGLVIAETREDAYTKVEKAYIAHGSPEYNFADVELWEITQKPFTDAPDVLEIYEY